MSQKQTRLWEKGEELNKLVHEFTVGNDPTIDLNLAKWDCAASAGHVRMLKKVGILNSDEESSLLKELLALFKRCESKEFSIANELEDCHTAIETELTMKLGESGKKVHTGRSRNDQVLVAMRLAIKERIFSILEQLLELANTLANRAAIDGSNDLPGYTHFQRAMPSSIAMFLGAHIEHTLELINEGLTLLQVIDCNPLGVAAGFGVPIKLDREFTTKLLGFNRVQRNPIAVQNSRGRFELKFTRWCGDIGSLIEKIACDFILFTSTEFNFFSLPNSLTTGSSIMPQKRNPDVVELLRAKGGKLRSIETELGLIICKLPSSYHRDFQLTKEPVFRAAIEVANMLPIIAEVISSFKINKSEIEKAMTPELYATYEAYRLVTANIPFREAYQKTATAIKEGKLEVNSLRKDFLTIQKTVLAELDVARTELKQSADIIREKSLNFKSKINSVFELKEN